MNNICTVFRGKSIIYRDDSQSIVFNSVYGKNISSTDTHYIGIPIQIDTSYLGRTRQELIGSCALISMKIGDTFIAYYAILGNLVSSQSWNSISSKLFSDMGLTINTQYEYTIQVSLDEKPNWSYITNIQDSIMTECRGRFGYQAVGDNTDRINYEALNPYVLRFDRTYRNYDFTIFKNKQVSGILLEAGYLYNELHQKVEYRNPYLQKQADGVKKSGFYYGLWTHIRARTVKEAEEECRELVKTARLFEPTLGIWCRLGLPLLNKGRNKQILDTYLKLLTDAGFSGKIGLISERSKLPFFSWDEISTNWYLWLVEPVINLDNLQNQVDPKFFEVG